jgi:hypothetical protein
LLGTWAEIDSIVPDEALFHMRGSNAWFQMLNKGGIADKINHVAEAIHEKKD